ncbi:MAG TPA: matrixin family metalloprotease [Acidimicrobiales bacterium]|nr:matrixin family metalloprotease [Acidimicrobiales bacterium]
MNRRLRLAIAGMSVASLVAAAGFATGLTAASSSAATHRVVVAPAPVNAVADRPTVPSTTTAPTTTVPPTTAPPATTPATSPARTAAPVTTAPRPVVVPTPPAPAPRVVVPSAAPPAVVASTPTGGTGSASDFALIGYRWNPCSVITVNSTGPDVSGIVSELASITGLHLQMVSGAAQINVQWGAVPPGGEIGLTAWRAVGKWLTTAGIVVSNQAQPYLATVLRHELGHALGLAHAAQGNEVMYPTVGSGSPTDYQAGDLAGLHAVGASAGC